MAQTQHIEQAKMSIRSIINSYAQQFQLTSIECEDILQCVLIEIANQKYKDMISEHYKEVNDLKGEIDALKKQIEELSDPVKEREDL